jgi:DNA-binding MarR family transcriptional regulator
MPLSSSSPPPLPESIDFLLAQICHLHHSRVHQLLEGLGLYRGQPPVLRILWREEGLTHTELAARLNITPATLSKMLQRMEKAGFLKRTPDPLDQRVSRVYLTETGRAVQSDVQRVLERIEAETFAGFSPEELPVLRQYLMRIRENLLGVMSDKPAC